MSSTFSSLISSSSFWTKPEIVVGVVIVAVTAVLGFHAVNRSGLILGTTTVLEETTASPTLQATPPATALITPTPALEATPAATVPTATPTPSLPEKPPATVTPLPITTPATERRTAKNPEESSVSSNSHQTHYSSQSSTSSLEESTVVTQSSSNTVVVAKANDTFWSIARSSCGQGKQAYRIREENGYTKKHLHPGDKIVVTCN